MKLRPVVCALTCSLITSWLISSMALAQQPRVTKIGPPVAKQQVATPTTTQLAPQTLSAPQVTPELWVYSQEQRRHDDPALAVRRKAEHKADQRLARLAAQKWYGYSNSRPEASPIPFMGQYSPSWVGNGWNRYDWYDAGPSVTLLIEGFELRR
jgi:hypothetical protein